MNRGLTIDYMRGPIVRERGPVKTGGGAVARSTVKMADYGRTAEGKGQKCNYRGPNAEHYDWR